MTAQPTTSPLPNADRLQPPATDEARSLWIPDRWPITEAQFRALAACNRDRRLECNAQGELIIMPPTGGETGARNIELAYQVQAWNRRTRLGIAFDSSTGFRLATGAIRSPDVSWMRADRWERLDAEARSGYVPACPDWLIELRSRTDRLELLQAKLQEYLAAGLQLGWLIDPIQQQVWIYQPDQAPIQLDRPLELSGDPVMPEFRLDLRAIWPPESTGISPNAP